MLSFCLRRQDVVKVGTAAIRTLLIPAETARCPIVGPSPQFFVIEAQSLGFSDPGDTVEFRPEKDCPVLSIPSPKLFALEQAPFRAAVRKVLRTSAPLSAPRVALLRAWRNKIGAAGRQFSRGGSSGGSLLVLRAGEQPANADAGGGGAQKDATASTEEARRTKRDRFSVAGGGLEASLRMDKDGAVVLGGKGPPAEMPTDTWRYRKCMCAPEFSRYLSEDDCFWICVRQAVLTETVTGMFQVFDERAVRLLANSLRLTRRGIWRSLTKAVDGGGFVAGFLGWFADLIE